MKAKTTPIIRQSELSDEWVIITRYTEKDGYLVAHTKYPIPEKDIEAITNKHLMRQLKGLEKGFTYEVGTGENRCKVTVERIRIE